MKGLTIQERTVLEAIGPREAGFDLIKERTGLFDDIVFKVIQGLIIKGIVKNDNGNFSVNSNISPFEIENINGKRARSLESMEFIENIILKGSPEDFRYQRFALSLSDEKIFRAMLYNLESFLKDSHLKNSKNIPLKDHKIVFWGLGDVMSMMKLISAGAQ